MEIQQTHRKINRPLVSLALVGALVSITPQQSHAAFFTTVIIPAIVGGIATGTAVGTVSGLLGWGLKQAEEANKTPDKPEKVWRIQAGRGFNEFPNKEYDLYRSLLSSKIDGGWDWGNAARHYWVKGGQWNKLEVDMKDAVGTYKLSGLRNYTGGDLDVNMQKATLRLGQFNGNSFTSYKDSADRTTRVDFNAKNILIDNFLEINNRVGSGAGRKASSTVLTLQASEGITSDKNAEISLYDGATLNLASNSVKLMGNVWMGRLQYVGAYLAPSYSTINTSKVTGEVNFNHLTVGDRNAAQAGIIASNKTHIGTLDLWQSAGLNIIAPPEGGYKDKPNNTPSQSGAKNDKNESAKNDKQESSQNNSNTQVINPPNSAQKTEIQPTQVIDGPFAGAKDTVVNINRINTNADGTIRVGGYTASLTTNAAHLNIGKGGVNLSNQASGRSLLVENLTGNITVNGSLMVNNQVGGYALAGSSANFEFKAGADTKNGTVTFNNDISLGRFVNLKVDAHTANFKGIDTGNGGFNTLDFSGVTNKVNINKLITASTNVAIKNFNINELLVKTNGISVGEYTHFSEDIGSQSRINTVRLETGTRSIYSGGVKFKSGEKLVINDFYYAPWNYFDARNIKNVEITNKLAFGPQGSPWGTAKLMFNNLTLGQNAVMDYSQFSNLTIQGHFTNNQGTMNLFVQDGRVATLNAGHQASMIFNNLVDSATGFYKPLIKINNAQNLTKNKEHVLVRARNIDYNLVGVQGASYDNISASNTNLQEQFKERLALYNNNNRMDICVVRNTDDIKACGTAIGDQSMVNNPDNYKYLIGKAWKNTGINKTADNTTIAVNLGNNSTPTENGGNTTNLPTNTTNKARFASYALIKNAPFAHYSATPNLVAINKHDFGTIESVFELADRSKDIDTLYANSGAQGRDLLQTLLIDSHDAGYARTMIDATSTNEITKQLNTATTTLNNIASLEHKTSGLQTLSLSNAMILNSRLVNLSRRHTNHIDSFAQRLQALKDQRFASLESAAEVLYQFAPKYEKPTNVWANAIGGASLNNGGNASLYGTSAGVDAYLNGEVEAIVGGFGSYGYSSFSNQANSLNSGANNTNFGVYSRLFANHHEFDFEAQGALGSDQSSLNFKSALLRDLNQSYNYLAYSAATRASYGYDFAFFRNALVLKPSVGVSYNHLGSTNFKSNSTNQVALKNGSNSQHLFNASANVEARYYYGDTSYFYMNAGVLQEFARLGSNNAASLNTFKVNAARNPLNTHARVMMGGELQLAKEVFLNLGVVYLHNLISNASHFASNLGMRYSF
ncbi:vacuolating cyotoxin family protein [Helicobacter pylori]|uniref:vacuolating cyotoxin family protein n=1 Tax=Helicobacter pylori TaxID=210 RepID=UPI000C30AC85|nr:vacuolating cyotoxin family protein [Helicobacter pylori]WRE45188.1 vacuolating cytotoxin autotransporter [Helicobacter pylori]